MEHLESGKGTDSTDDLLLARYKQERDLRLLGELYERHSEMIYYVCLRYLKDSERSKDAVMHIFEELVQKVDRQEIRSFQQWIYVVAKNHCLMALRGDKSAQNNFSVAFVEFDTIAHPVDVEDADTEKEQLLQALERCIERLPENQRASIQLFFFEKKCYKEIAEMTAYSLDGVKSYIQNGKRNLKICVEREQDA